jgi:mutual gliding-motility protein MglA
MPLIKIYDRSTPVKLYGDRTPQFSSYVPDIKVFISYSRNDNDMVAVLKGLFAQHSIHYWLDHERLKPGNPDWEASIRRGIATASAIILVASPDSQQSRYVRDELAIAEMYKLPVYPIWVRGEQWMDSVPLGWGRTQHIDARGSSLITGCIDLVGAITTDFGTHLNLSSTFVLDSQTTYHPPQGELTIKIVYYGIGLSGKAENLQWLYKTIDPKNIGNIISIETGTERSLYFDLLPLDLGFWNGFKVRAQLYMVPGQVIYQQTRISVLKGADGVVFVADSQASKLKENMESWAELIELLRRQNKSLAEFPIIIQWSKRELPDVLPIPILEQYLNPFHKPSFEADLSNGRGIMETLTKSIQMTLASVSKTL